MIIAVTQAQRSEKKLLDNLYPLYLHDLSEFSDDPVEGQVDEEGNILPEWGIAAWWEKEGLYPHVIRVDGKPAGFVFVVSSHFCEPGTDYSIQEFFVLRKYRRKGVGRQAAMAVFDLFPGRWEVSQMPLNTPAVRFWHSVVDEYTHGRYVDLNGSPLPDHSVPGQRFTSPPQPASTNNEQ